LSILYLWVETFEFDPSIIGRKLPVNAFLGRIAPLLPLCGFLDERLTIWDPSVQVLYGQDAELDLGDIVPTAMLGSMMALQTGRPVFGLVRVGRPHRGRQIPCCYVTPRVTPFAQTHPSFRLGLRWRYITAGA